MRDALKNYLTLASGLTEVGRQRAVAASKALVAQGEATAEQVGGLADDLIQTSKSNRDMVTALVRSEVERAMQALGVATADSVEYLTKRLQSLESALRDAADAESAAAPAKAAKKTTKAAGTGGDVTATHDLAGPATKATAKTAKPAAKAAAKPAKAAQPAKPAKKAEPAKKAAAKKPAKKAKP
ncbi:MAG TPA: hypothetical protein VNA20_13495 [Frankiaceae bacterium]|nr:hypothetical protein [Frankiaceae bacterium]